MKKLIVFMIIVIMLAACTVTPQPQAIDTFSKIVNVPGTYGTITQAVNAAEAGWIINVQPGTYPERIKVAKSGLTLQASGKVNVMQIYVTGSNNVIRGFTVKDPGVDAGLRVEGDGNLFENNEVSNTKQDGVWFFGKNNTFRGNYIHDILDPSIAGDPHVDCFQTYDYSWDTVGTIIENNICDHTRASLSNQIIIVTGRRTSNTIIRNNRFIMHDAGYSPVALYGGSGYVVENNYICNTTGRGEDAIYISGASGVTIIGNTWSGYGALYRGTPSAQSGNVKGALPCVVFPSGATSTPLPAPTKTYTPAPSNTRTPVVTVVPTLTPGMSNNMICYITICIDGMCRNPFQIQCPTSGYKVSP